MRKLMLITILTAVRVIGMAQSGPATASFGDAASESGSTTLVVVPMVPSSFQLSKGEKFRRFVSQSTDPGNVLGAGIEAGLSQASHDNLGFGQGADGYGKRLGAAVADRASFAFFSQFALPVVFHQDPRYPRAGKGGLRRRLIYAGTRAFLGKSDSGGRMFNVSTVGGAFLSAGLANAYYPEGERTLGFTLRSGALNVGSAISVNLGREFWPDIRKKLFRGK